jgi:hypothetical protein
VPIPRRDVFQEFAARLAGTELHAGKPAITIANAGNSTNPAFVDC